MGRPAISFVVMGVSGAGKSLVGARLAAELGADFADGDDFHSADNVAKMSSGASLDDTDRWPWLAAIAAGLAVRPGAVVACSALTRAYRHCLRSAAPGVFFVELDVPRAELMRRVTARAGHFMPADLLESQLSTLRPLADDEYGARIDATGAVDTVVAAALRVVRRA